MAKNNRRLSRENVQDFLSKSEPDTGGSDSGDKSPKREPKKSSFRGTIAVGATIAGRLTRGANTLGGTLADSIRAEVTHSDFGVRLKAFGIGMAVAAALLAVWMLVPWFQRWDTIPYDLKMRTRFTNAPESGSIVHMDLDDQTFASVGRWPWSREKWAGFVGAANEAGVRHLVFDVEYSQPQQEEVDRNAFRRFREWGEHELPSRIGGVQSFVAEAVALAEKNISATAEQLANASTVEEAKQLRNEIARQVLELKRIREQLRDNPLDRELVDAFIEQASDVVMDYDDQFAAAVLEAGNVVIPHRFDRSALTQAQVGRPIVTKELFEAIERHFDTVGAENLGRVSRDDVPAGIIGMQIRDEVAGETVTVDEKLARKYADETYTNVRMLYLYRLVRRWYASQPAEQVWSDMASFLSSRTEFSESCFVPGQVFGRLSDAFQATGFQHDWVRQALEQLHRYYSWVQLTEGKQDKSRRPAWLAGLPKESVIGHDAPVALPIDVIQGYKMEEWDPWEPRVDSHDGGSGLFHYRDTGFSPAIFRLFNASCSTGFVSIEHDYDGTVRRTPLFVICEDTFHGKRYVVPQMAFMTAMMEVAADRSSIKIVPGQYVEFRAIRDLVEALRKDVPLPSADWNRIVAGVKEADYETYRIKVDKRCMVKINWAGGDNTPFFELFGHIPVSRIIDIAEAGRELERNRQQLARGLADPRNRLDKLTYQTGKRTALFEHYNMPAMQTTRWLGSNAEGWPERLKLSISDLHADLVLKHHRDRVAELQANSAAWEAAYAMEDGEAKAATLEKLENALATRDAERLGQTLSSFRQELHRLLGWPEAVAPEDLPGLLDASGLTEAASAKVAESLGKLDGAPVTDTKALGELASALAGDVDAPHLKFMHTRLNTSKRLTSPQKAKLMLFVLQAKSGLLSEGPLFSDSMEQIDQLCVTATGHKPADIPTEREWAMERQLFQDYDVGRLRDNGTALRKLLFDLEHPIKTEDLTAAKANPSGPQAVRVLKRLGWEIPLLKQADMLAAEDPALTIVSAEGFDPENVEENLRTALLAFEPSDTGIVIRRRNSLFATVASVEARFSQDRQTKLEAARKLVGDRFALVGWASTGSGDLIVTPNSRSIPGPALHSNMFNTVLHGIEPIPAHGLTVVIAVLCGLLVSFSTARLPVKWAIGATVLTFVAAWFVDSYFFSSKAWSIQTLSIMAPVAFGFLSIQGYRYAVEYRAKLKIKGQFGKFLSAEAVEELQKNPDMLKLGGDEKQLCVLFSDIAGFTPISESMSAPRLIDFLNDYMGRMCESIRESKGYVDKFIGDAIMAIWGAPVPVPDYSARAVKTAIRNTQALAAWNREREARGELKVGARIGLATGPMVAGNMGTEWKLNYTCIGDTVNLGARLEAANKQYGTQIMINQLCWEQARDVIVGHVLDNIAVKGKKKGVPVFHVIGLVGEVEPKYVKGAELYTQAFELYQKEKWAEALALFKEAQPNLPPPYDVKLGPCDHMIERCETLAKATRAERMEILHLKTEDDEWDGVWKLTSK